MNSSLLDALFPACIALELYRATVGDYQAKQQVEKRKSIYKSDINCILFIHFPCFHLIRDHKSLKCQMLMTGYHSDFSVK